MTEKEELIIFVATIYGEAAGQSPASWKAIANVIKNRLKQGREWKKYKTPLEIIQHTNFDAYTTKNTPYKQAYDYLSGKSKTVPSSARIDAVKKAVEPIYFDQEEDTTNGAVLYYSPRAQQALYGHPPKWNFSLLEEVKVSGTEADDFKFFRYKSTSKVKVSVSRLNGPVEQRAVKIQIGDQTKVVKTDEHGDLPVFHTDMVGKKLTIWVKDTKDEFAKVYEEVISGIDLAINIVRNKLTYETATRRHDGKPEQKNKTEHKVKRGQTIGQIAMLYNTSVQAICELNGIKNANLVHPGQVLRIPDKEQTAKSGEIKPAPPPAAAPAASGKPAGSAHPSTTPAATPAATSAHGSTSTPPPKQEDRPRSQETYEKKEAEQEKHQGRNQSGNPEMIVGVPARDGDVIRGLLFPIAGHDRKSYKKNVMGSFGWRRDGGKRKHAGCDIYAEPGTPIRAVADGVVLEVHPFYWETNRIIVDHHGFIVNYGEVSPSPQLVKVGDRVTRGQIIARVGTLRRKKNAPPEKTNMLHFELYGTSKPLKEEHILSRPGVFQRRSDLMDPTKTLDAAES